MLASNQSALLTTEILDMLSAVFGDLDKDSRSDSGMLWQGGDHILPESLVSTSPVESINTCMEGASHGTLSPKSDDQSSFLNASAVMPLRKIGQYRMSHDMNSNSYGRFVSPTTLMMKNIPTKLTREELLGWILSGMAQSSFNFLYMPIDFKTRCNFGYAFINFTSEVYIDRFTDRFHKQRMNSFDFTSRPVEVVIARVQGFNANINRLISSPVLFAADEESLPLIFSGNRSVPFRQLMDLNRASILYHTKPSVDELLAQLLPYL